MDNTLNKVAKKNTKEKRKKILFCGEGKSIRCYSRCDQYDDN